MAVEKRLILIAKLCILNNQYKILHWSYVRMRTIDLVVGKYSGVIYSEFNERLIKG